MQDVDANNNNLTLPIKDSYDESVIPLHAPDITSLYS